MPNVSRTTRVEISPLGSPPPLAVCEGNQVLWIADTDCGSNLVPESDVIRGVAQVVANGSSADDDGERGGGSP